MGTNGCRCVHWPRALSALQRDDAATTWNTALNALAGVTENAQQGDRTAILSAGFEVRGTRTPTPPLPAPTALEVSANGTPGVSKLKGEPVHGAVSYLVSPDPITEDGWVQVDTPTKSTCAADGAEPGKVQWFRVAGVNASGSGPWSEPAKRPVMLRATGELSAADASPQRLGIRRGVTRTLPCAPDAAPISQSRGSIGT